MLQLFVTEVVAVHMCYLRRIAKIRFFAGISDLTDIVAVAKQKIVILRPLASDKVMAGRDKRVALAAGT